VPLPLLTLDLSFEVALRHLDMSSGDGFAALHFDESPEGKAALWCALHDSTRTLEQLVPWGWHLVSSDVLGALDPAKDHPSYATHWHRSLALPVRARKWLGLRWIYALVDTVGDALEMELSRCHADASWLGDAGLEVTVGDDDAGMALLRDEDCDTEFAMPASELLEKLTAIKDGGGWHSVMRAMEGGSEDD
jgi:hypothetical protein